MFLWQASLPRTINYSFFCAHALLNTSNHFPAAFIQIGKMPNSDISSKQATPEPPEKHGTSERNRWGNRLGLCLANWKLTVAIRVLVFWRNPTYFVIFLFCWFSQFINNQPILILHVFVGLHNECKTNLFSFFNNLLVNFPHTQSNKSIKISFLLGLAQQATPTNSSFFAKRWFLPKRKSQFIRILFKFVGFSQNISTNKSGTF